MAVTKHMPDNSPEPAGSAWPGYPRGVWPPILSAFCRDRALSNTRHVDCSMPACSCPCHARVPYHGTAERMKSGKEAQDEAIAQSKRPKQSLPEASDVLGRLDRLGKNRDSTRTPLHK